MKSVIPRLFLHLGCSVWSPQYLCSVFQPSAFKKCHLTIRSICVQKEIDIYILSNIYMRLSRGNLLHGAEVTGGGHMLMSKLTSGVGWGPG